MNFVNQLILSQIFQNEFWETELYLIHSLVMNTAYVPILCDKKIIQI